MLGEHFVKYTVDEEPVSLKLWILITDTVTSCSAAHFAILTERETSRESKSLYLAAGSSPIFAHVISFQSGSEIVRWPLISLAWRQSNHARTGTWRQNDNNYPGSLALIISAVMNNKENGWSINSRTNRSLQWWCNVHHKSAKDPNEVRN
jgi:hypothetical protein